MTAAKSAGRTWPVSTLAGRPAELTASVRAWPKLNVHAILIERSGRLVYEEYFDGFDEKWGPLGGGVDRTGVTA